MCLVLPVLLVVQASVPMSVVDEARGTAARIFSRAGITVEWTESPAPKAVEVQVLNRRPKGLIGDANGYTILPRGAGVKERYAGVFYPAVVESAGQIDSDIGLLLGAVLAHEIGHILLGTNAHSRNGVMVPRYEHQHIRLAGHGLLLFTPEESGRMRAALPGRDSNSSRTCRD